MTKIKILKKSYCVSFQYSGISLSLNCVASATFFNYLLQPKLRERQKLTPLRTTVFFLKCSDKCVILRRCAHEALGKTLRAI